MPYGLIYQGEFSSISEIDYRLEILRKDYSGPFYTLPMASTPVVHNWGPDDSKAPVKGSSLSINYLNMGSNPIENFFSVNDDDFKVIFYKGTDVLFQGFLVQDDIREPLIDYTHEVSLSANDGLGLLKDVAFNKYPLGWYNPQTLQGRFSSFPPIPQNILFLRNSVYTPAVGVPFTITGHPVPIMNQTFTPIAVTVISPGNYDLSTSTYTGDTSAEPVFINGAGGTLDFYSRNTLLNAIAVCLQNTGIELETYVYENIYEVSHNTASCSLAQTIVDYKTFLSGDDFIDCYTVLSKILDRFNLTLFQSLGRWNIIRWDELRLNTAINGFIYNSTFTLLGTTTLDTGLIFGFQESTSPVTGLSKSPNRPFNYVKEKFDYKTPKYILYNNDLAILGALLRTYTSGATQVKEFEAIGWLNTYIAPHVERFIRVIYDLSTLIEKERYLVLRGPTSGTANSLPSNPIECNQGDRLAFSCTFRTNISQSPGTVYFALRITDGVNVRVLDSHLSTATVGTIGQLFWSSGAIAFVFPAGGDSSEWNTVDTATSIGPVPVFPFTGLLTVFLPTATDPPQSFTRETHFKDIRFEYIPYVNDSIKIIGHTHKDIQNVVMKNNNESDIAIDDSPRNSVQGTLFRNAMTGNVQQRTVLWYRSGVVESFNLGEIITKEHLQWRSVTRVRLDGNFIGIFQLGQNISLLNHFKYSQMPGLNFLFGTLQIDYRNNRLACTAYEQFKDGEADIAEDYSLTYIYDSK